jgi:ferredoxin
MAYMITTECINCNACYPECPNDAIYEGGQSWTYGDKIFGEGESLNGDDSFWSTDYFYIVPEKCTECKGWYDEPQCVKVCPIDCCLPDPKYQENEENLLKKKESLESINK